MTIQLLNGSGLDAALVLCCMLLPALGGLAAWVCGALADARQNAELAELRDVLTLFTVIGTFCCVVALPSHGSIGFALPGVCGLGLSFATDGLRLTLCLLAAFLWLMTTLFSREYMAHSAHKTRYALFLLLTEGATLGVFFSADLYTLLVCFEVMSITSWVLVAHEETPGAQRAADSYLAFAVIGGLATLMGLFMLYNLLGTLTISALPAAAARCENRAALYTAGALTLTGFAAKAGMWPLHTWLPAAHPVAPAPASALLSGIITKAGMFGILALSARLFAADGNWGLVMLCFGLVTMVTGAVLAVFSVDLKRTLACSSMSQIGFILVGVGMSCLLGSANGAAVWGLVLHICNHSLFKLTLFLCAGVVVMNLHQLELNDIRGFGRGKPALLFAFAMGALGIMGVPGWSGYVSKTLLHESIVEYAEILQTLGLPAGFFRAAEWLFLISGGLTVAYMTKLFVCLFIEKNADPAVQARFDALNGHYMTPLTETVLLVSAALIPLLGLTPHDSMEKLAALAGTFFGTAGPAHTVAYFGAESLAGAAVSLAIGAAVYLLAVRGLLMRQGRYLDRWPKALDLENRLYRPLVLRALPFAGALCARLAASVFEWLRAAACRVLFFRDQGGYVTPPEDDRFTVYEQQPRGVRGFTGSLSYSLMLFGFGMAAVLLYLFARGL